MIYVHTHRRPPEMFLHRYSAAYLDVTEDPGTAGVHTKNQKPPLKGKYQSLCQVAGVSLIQLSSGLTG